MISYLGGTVVEEQGVGVELVVDALGALMAGAVPAHGKANGRGDVGTAGAGHEFGGHIYSNRSR